MIRIAVNKQRKQTPAEVLADLRLGDDPLLKTEDAAALICLSPKTLRQLRCDKKGPRFLKLGASKKARTVYRRSDLEQWIRENARVVGGA